MTEIMRCDLCGISQLLPLLTIKWDIPADPLIEAHSELRIYNFSAFDCCRQLVSSSRLLATSLIPSSSSI